MYVTRPLSLYKKSPSALSDPPPDGPGSGILVVQDAEAQPKCCFGLAKSDKIRDLPIPQNKSLEIYYARGFSYDRDLHFHSVWFIPVLGLPLSANQYYAVHPLGKNRGEAFVSAKEDELESFCCYVYAPETQPQPFDPDNIYQKMEITRHARKLTPWGSEYELKSTAPDGFAPGFLGRKEGWKLNVICDAPEFELGEALGLDKLLREHLPDFDFPLSDCENSKPVVVGKWYSPFVFIREGTPRTMRDERRMSMFYEMTLEQRWERIHECENDRPGNNSIVFDCVVRNEVVVVGGREAVVDKKDMDDGILWFRSVNNFGKESSIGLNVVIVERMKWEQERVGCILGKEKEVKVEKREVYGGVGEWKRFGCYVLVESFILKRMNGSVAITHEFRHTHQIRTKWE